LLIYQCGDLSSTLLLSHASYVKEASQLLHYNYDKARGQATSSEVVPKNL